MEGGSAACRKATLLATPTAGLDGLSAASGEWSVPAPGRITVDLSADSAWSLSVTCPRMWAPEVRLEPGTDEEVVHFSLLATGEIAGRLVSAGRELNAGGALEVRLQASGKDDLTWRSADVLCPLTDGEFRCEIPAVGLDARFTLEGYAPHYTWGLRIPAGETVDLGDFEQVEGASVTGTVIDPRGRGPAVDPESEIELLVEQLVEEMPAEPERERLQLRAARATADERGFFQVIGLAPGRYELTALLANHSPAHVSPIVLDVGEEHLIERPISLQPLVTLEVFVDPSHDVAGQPWQLRVLGNERPNAGGTLRDEIAKGSATLAGYWSHDGFATGNYLVRVEDAAGSIWSDTRVELIPGLGPLTIQLPAVAVEGEVWLRDAPVAAEIYFGTSTGIPSVRIESDDEGKFSGVLPREGEWPLEIRLAGRPPQALDPVEVRREAGGVAELSLRLPDTRLTGEVVDGDGEPAAGVHVFVIREQAKASALEREVGIEHRRRREISVTSDRDGQFEIDALQPGQLAVFAHDSTRTSEWLEVELGEGSPTPPLRLVVRERAQVTGRVLSTQGPIAGAVVIGFSRGRLAPIDPFAQGVTGADGRFTFEVTRGTDVVDLFVTSPDHDVLMRRVSLSAQPLEITVTRNGGRLLLESPQQGATLFHSGAELPLDNLLSLLFPLGRIAIDSGVVSIDGFESGAYVLCPLHGVPACASGVLTTGAELHLQARGIDRKETDP